MTETPENPTGPIWSAILAASLGCAVLGILTILTEISPGLSKALAFVKTSGDLSGATILSLLAWIATWIALHRLWKSRTIQATGWLFIATIILIAIGLLGTFPPVADMLGGQ